MISFFHYHSLTQYVNPHSYTNKYREIQSAMRRVIVFAILFLAVFIQANAFGVSLAQGRDSSHPWDYKRVYYVIEYLGQLREKGFFVRRPGSYQRQPCIIYDEEKTSNALLNGLPVTRVFRSKTITSLSGSALFRNEEAIMGEMGMETVAIRDGLAEIRANGYFGQPIDLPVPPGTLFEISGEWLAANSPQSGKRLGVDVLDREGRRVLRENVVYGNREPGTEGNPDVWVAEFAGDGEQPMLARFTRDGRLLRLEGEGLIYQVVSREEYGQGRISSRQSLFRSGEEEEYAAAIGGPGAVRYGGTGQAPAISIGAAIPGWDTFVWLVIQAGPPGMWDRTLQTSEYAQIDNLGGYYSITAVRNAPRVDVNLTLPMQTPSEIQPFLGTHQLVPSQNNAIIRAARAAVADTETRRPESNALRAVSYLAGWINQEIGFESTFQPNIAAPDVLSARSGDSLGHARLFVAMARSLGIPSRVCQGLLVQTGQAVFHAWAEAWIGGVWVPVDTTVSRVGLPAGYILVERSGPDTSLAGDFVEFLRLPQLTLTMISAGRETPLGALAELTVNERRTYAAYEGDWLANLYWGFAMRLPAGWNGKAGLNNVTIQSPDREASVTCEALQGDFRVGQSELDSNIENLRSNLRAFRLIDSRLVSFDTDGATPALFMDFACEQNGKNWRCRQYVLPRRQRAFRISFWAPADYYDSYAAHFDSIIASFEY